MRQISISIERYIFTLIGVVAPAVGTDESGASLQPVVEVPRSAGRLRPMDNEEPPSDIKKTHQSYSYRRRIFSFSHKKGEILIEVNRVC